MFKNKKTLFVLVPLTIFIWSYVGYTIYSYFHDDYEFLEHEYKAPLVKLKKNDTIDYKLALNYPDPFLKKEVRSKPNNQTNNNPKPQINPVPQKTIATLPKLEVKYMGVVENKTSGAATGLISINGKSYLVKKGEMVEGVLIKSLSSEKLEVKIGKENLTVLK